MINVEFIVKTPYNSFLAYGVRSRKERDRSIGTPPLPPPPPLLLQARLPSICRYFENKAFAQEHNTTTLVEIRVKRAKRLAITLPLEREVIKLLR